MNIGACARVLIATLLLLGLSGCGGGSDTVELFKATGVVTFDGAPLNDAEIRFVSADGKRTDAGQVTNGSYQVEATPGAKRVEIYASRVDSTKKPVESGVEPGKMEPVMEMYIPAKYNTNTELKAEITKAGPNKFDFPLTP